MDHFVIHYVSREGDVALKLILLSSFMRATPFAGGQPAPDVSIVLPCLNQARGLPFALANARAGLLGLERELGLTGEIILADAGSRDGSQMIAIAEGVRVVDAPGGGYGATLRGGLAQARGRYLIMGDIDGSCDFRDCVAMVRALMRGVDLFPPVPGNIAGLLFTLVFWRLSERCDLSLAGSVGLHLPGAPATGRWGRTNHGDDY